MKSDWKTLFSVKNIGLILLGNTIYSFGIVAFILSSGLITGGTAGLGLIFFHQFGLPISTFISIFNVTAFVLGAIILGKKFALTTLISSFYYPFILSIFEKVEFLQSITNDRVLCTIYAGLLIGIGIGLVLRAGASTGGVDIPVLILNKKFGLPVSATLYAIDVCILLGQMIFADKEQVLYGICLVFIYTIVLDKVLMFGKSHVQVKIISKFSEEIRNAVLQKLDRGVTLLHGQTGHLGQECDMVLTVVSNRELPRLNEMVLEIDPHAFMIINKVNEVKGKGFTLGKKQG